MLTRIETQYMNAVIGIHDEIRKANERGVDWEQRRYEIAKEMLPYVAETTRSILASGHGLGDEAEGKTVPEVCASSAVVFADALIAELKKEKKAELSQSVTKTGDKDDEKVGEELIELLNNLWAEKKGLMNDREDYEKYVAWLEEKLKQ